MVTVRLVFTNPSVLEGTVQTAATDTGVRETASALAGKVVESALEMVKERKE